MKITSNTHLIVMGLFEFLLCMSDATLKIADTLELHLIRAMKLKM